MSKAAPPALLASRALLVLVLAMMVLATLVVLEFHQDLIIKTILEVKKSAKRGTYVWVEPTNVRHVHLGHMRLLSSQ
jgi:hypothetical protein